MANLTTAKGQQEEIENLLKKYDKKLAAAFMEGVRVLADAVVLKDIAEVVRTGRPSAVWAIINDALITASFTAYANVLQSALMDGGDLGRRIAQANRVEFRFSVTESNTARYMENYVAERIRQISEQTKGLISQIVYRETSAGKNPIETARKIRDGLGLTDEQERAVQSYRRQLEDLEGQALERRLRDGRYDRTVARAIREGQPLPKERIDKMVEAYRRRSIIRRSQTIARTEGNAMVQTGEDQYFKQMIRAGVVREEQIQPEWIYTHDSKVRSSHAAIPKLNPDGRPPNGAFRSPLGPIRYPCDPAAPAANRINCRCALFYRIKTTED